MYYGFFNNLQVSLMKRLHKRCKNPSCGCCFRPNKYRPNQEYCGKDECKRYRDRIRQWIHYRTNIRDSKWRANLMKRKKRERFARKNSPNITSTENKPSLPEIQMLLSGMIALFSGAETKKEVFETIEVCSRFGNSICCNDFAEVKKIKKFPHASYEAVKKCSSHQIFT